MDGGKKSLGFTLIELVAILTLLSIFWIFLARLNCSYNNPSQSIKLATKILVSTLDDVRSQAILNSNYASVIIDVSSKYKFRRIAICRKTNDDSWNTEHVIILPERTFILSLSELSEYLDYQDLSDYHYTEEDFSINGETVTGYRFIFDDTGKLCNFKNNSSIIGLACGRKKEKKVQTSNNLPFIGIFVFPTGKQVILKSKEEIRKILKK